MLFAVFDQFPLQTLVARMALRRLHNGLDLLAEVLVRDQTDRSAGGGLSCI